MSPDYISHVKVFRALANEERLQMIRVLLEKSICAGDMEKLFYMEQSTTSHHLNVLKSAGILRAEKRGRHIFYFVDTHFCNRFYPLFMKDMGIPSES